MKNLILILVTAVFALASKAQSNSEEITLLQSIYGMEKRDLIAMHIKIEVTQSDLFWQLYDEYEIARKEIGIKRTSNINDYAKKYENLTNEDADALLKASMEVQKGFINLWDKTYKKMAILISPVTVAQFIQAEMFLENMIRQEFSMDIPLIGEFEIQK